MLVGEGRRTVPFLIDMKIFYALPKMSFVRSGAKPPPNKALGTFAAHFTPSQQTQNGCGATGSTNSEISGDQAGQANGGQFPGKGAKPKALGLRKRR